MHFPLHSAVYCGIATTVDVDGSLHTALLSMVVTIDVDGSEHTVFFLGLYVAVNVDRRLHDRARRSET